MVDRRRASSSTEGWICLRSSRTLVSLLFQCETRLLWAFNTVIWVFSNSGKMSMVPSRRVYTIASIRSRYFFNVSNKSSTLDAVLLLLRCFVIVLLITSCQITIFVFLASTPLPSRRFCKIFSGFLAFRLKLNPPIL